MKKDPWNIILVTIPPGRGISIEASLAQGVVMEAAERPKRIKTQKNVFGFDKRLTLID